MNRLPIVLSSERGKWYTFDVAIPPDYPSTALRTEVERESTNKLGMSHKVFATVSFNVQQVNSNYEYRKSLPKKYDGKEILHISRFDIFPSTLKSYSPPDSNFNGLGRYLLCSALQHIVSDIGYMGPNTIVVYVVYRTYGKLESPYLNKSEAEIMDFYKTRFPNDIPEVEENIVSEGATTPSERHISLNEMYYLSVGNLELANKLRDEYGFAFATGHSSINIVLYAPIAHLLKRCNNDCCTYEPGAVDMEIENTGTNAKIVAAVSRRSTDRSKRDYARELKVDRAYIGYTALALEELGFLDQNVVVPRDCDTCALYRNPYIETTITEKLNGYCDAIILRVSSFALDNDSDKNAVADVIMATLIPQLKTFQGSPIVTIAILYAVLTSISSSHAQSLIIKVRPTLPLATWSYYDPHGASETKWHDLSVNFCEIIMAHFERTSGFGLLRDQALPYTGLQSYADISVPHRIQSLRDRKIDSIAAQFSERPTKLKAIQLLTQNLPDIGGYCHTWTVLTAVLAALFPMNDAYEADKDILRLLDNVLNKKRQALQGDISSTPVEMEELYNMLGRGVHRLAQVFGNTVVTRSSVIAGKPVFCCEKEDRFVFI